MTIFKSKSKCASIRKQLRLGDGIPFFFGWISTLTFGKLSGLA
jgi:hypothetical protein